jgi:hypothetical protein
MCKKNKEEMKKKEKKCGNPNKIISSNSNVLLFDEIDESL